MDRLQRLWRQAPQAPTNARRAPTELRWPDQSFLAAHYPRQVAAMGKQAQRSQEETAEVEHVSLDLSESPAPARSADPRAALRRALILGEILAPPLALRDDPTRR